MSREMEMLFQASRTSPALHEAAVCVEADLRNLQGENERLKREVEAQMESKLDAQSLLANICAAIDLSRMSFDLNDTWGTAAPRIIERLTEIVSAAEADEAEVTRLQEGLRQIEEFSYPLNGTLEAIVAMKAIARSLLADNQDASPLSDKPIPPQDIERAAELARERGWKNRDNQEASEPGDHE